MIWESVDWKKPLLSSAKWLRSVRLSERTRESTYVRIEKEIFFGFYSIRKLFEALKVSDSTRTFMYDLAWYPNRKPVDHLNWHRLGELYDLDRPEEHIARLRACALRATAFAVPARRGRYMKWIDVSVTDCSGYDTRE